MFIGSDEEILGMPEESKGISTPVEHRFDYDVNKVKEGTNFTPTEPKKKKEQEVVIIERGKKDGKRGKSSNLF